jgi:hypothetical protein
VDESNREDVTKVMLQINQLWLRGRVDEMASVVHPEIVMVFPGFGGRQQGRDAFLSGFHDFLRTATIHEFREEDLEADVAGETAVVTFRYDMVYERSSQRYRSVGRDLWVFQKLRGAWIAVWRTMLDVEENAA